MVVEGAVAVVTGAAAGTGRAIALRLALEGARVVIVDLDQAQGALTEDHIRAAGGEARFVPTDVTRYESVRAMAGAVQSTFGELGVLVNNAGGAENPPFPDASIEELDRCLDLNLRAPLYTIRESLPALRRRGGGAIVNIASIGGRSGGPDNFPAYNAAKAGLIRLTETPRPTCRAYGVTIDCLTPDLILTERVRRDLGLGLRERPPSSPDAVEPETVAAQVVELVRG